MLKSKKYIVPYKKEENRLIKKGEKKGFKAGIEIGIEKVAMKMIKSGLDLKTVAKSTGLRLKEVEKLSKSRKGK